jgi:hypothetical protein
LLLNLLVPRINDHMTEAVLEAVYAREGEALPLGARLFDLTVDLSVAAPHDCPPISHYRIVIRERVWLRRLAAGRGGKLAVGDELALFSTEPQEALDASPARGVRCAVAMIMYQSAWGAA